MTKKMTSVRVLFTWEFACRLMLISILSCVCQAELKASVLGPLLNNDILISGTGLQAPERAHVAFDGDRYLVVWSGYTDTTTLFTDVYGQFIDRLGVPSGPSFLVVSKPAGQNFPTVAFNGSHYLVAWSDSGGAFPTIRARVLSTAGVLLGPEIVLAGARGLGLDSVAVASDGSGFLVVWGTSGNIFSGTTADVLRQSLIVDTSGNASLAGSTLSIAATTEEEVHPNVAFGQTQYLVT